MADRKNICAFLIALIASIALVFAYPAHAYAASVGSVYVTVLNSQDSSQIETSATLVLEGSSYAGESVSQTVSSDSSGQAVFTNIPAGNYTVTQVSAAEGYALPESPSLSVTLGMETYSYTGTITFQNNGYEQTPESQEEDTETQTIFIDQPSWYVSSFVDQNGASVAGLVASQNGTSAYFDGAKSAEQQSSVGTQSVSVEYNGLSSSVSDAIPSGEQYVNTQSFSLTMVDVQSASVTLVNDPLNTGDDEQASDSEQEQPQDEQAAPSDSTSNLPHNPNEAADPTQTTQAELENQADEQTSEEEQTEDAQESREASTTLEDSSGDNDTKEELVSPIVQNESKTPYDEGTVPALERLIPDPALRALLAFIGLLGGAVVLIVVSRKSSTD